MKVLFALHGYPPELVGGTESTVRAQARGLVARGVDVVVVAGSMRWEEGFRTSLDHDVDPESGRSYPVHRIHRADLFFDHWQKSAHPGAARAFREILETERPDVVHVQHWIRLSRDLVATAARAGVPAVVTLHDLWTTCLVSFRVRPDTEEACDATLGFSPCVECAKGLPPRTPWVTTEAAAVAFAERTSEVHAELDLARRVVAPSRAHAATAERFLGREEGSLQARVVPPGRDLALARRAPLAPPAPAPSAPRVSSVPGTPASGEDAAGSGGGKLVLSSWGHLHPLKGADLVVDAIRRLPDPSRVALHLAGEEVRADYAERVREAARGLDVRFHGRFEADQLDRHPATEAHAMVSGSRAHESWGLVLDEAWALGLPAVLPREGAFAERAEGGRGGLLYERGDAASLAAALARLLDEPELLPALRASVPARPCPSVAESVEALLEVYAEAAAAGPPPAPEDPRLRDLVRARALEAWDASLSRRTPEELGFGGEDA